MSSILSRESISPITLWRRSQHEDVPSIIHLFNVPQTIKQFGHVDVPQLIEHSYLSLSEMNEDDNIVAFISLFDYPNIPDTLANMWLLWIQQNFHLPEVTTRNTLFIHLLVWNSQYTYEFLEPLLHAVFLNCVYVNNLALLMCPEVTPNDMLLDFFTPVAKLIEAEHNLYICPRQTTIPRFKFRLAVVEDFEDIAPIIDKETNELRMRYGDNCLAEVIANPTIYRQIIVGEKQNIVIGVASINTDINLDILNEYFELGPFYGLRIPSECDHIPIPKNLYVDSREGLIMQLMIQSNDGLSTLSTAGTLIETDFSSNSQSTEHLSNSSSDDIIFEESSSSYMSDSPTYSSSDSNKSEDSISPTLRDTENENLPQFHVQDVKIPIYSGRNNAFAIEVFGMDENCDERLAFQFIQTIFDCVPEIDYCVLTIPSTYPEFPLLQHFVRVPPRPYKNFGHELYVAHRNAVLGEMGVRVAMYVDHISVSSLLGFIKYRNNIYNDFTLATNNKNNPFKAYVLTSNNEIVGVAILTAVNNMEYLITHYQIEDYVLLSAHKSEQHGYLKHLVVSPIFHNQSRFFLQEIHRQSKFTCLYYTVYCRDSQENAPSQSMVSVLEVLIPVKPRRQIEYHLQTTTQNDLNSVLQIDEPFALFHTNKRLNSLPKTAVNDHIIVVGASDVAMAFLEKLVLGSSFKHISFNNITLVTLHGLPGVKYPYAATNKLMIYKGRYNTRYMSQISLRSWINLVYGVMTSINRIKKQIVVNNEYILPYDYLMLFCGEQLQKPLLRYKKEVQQSNHYKKKPFEGNHQLPLNVFIINSEIDAINSLVALKRIIDRRNEYKIIVYGHCLSAFCCVAALQDFDIPNNNIIFVEPFPQEAPVISVFNDHEVDDAVITSMKNDGIAIYSPFYFSSWEESELEPIITKVTIESKTQICDLECAAMFFYGKRCVSEKTFMALNKASLVYDGHLVIDNQYCTNDPFVYAAGSLTKYSVHYYADRYRHKFYSSIEVGEAVAKRMLSLWYPCSNQLQEQDHELVPTFYKPLVVSCSLPGGINYLNISKPGLLVPLDAAISQDDYGLALVTGDCKSEQGYFRIHFNTFNMVETITCYTKKDIDVENIISLYGKHAHLLNNLMERYDLGLIQDFYEYFREPWVYALYHDQFIWLQKDIRQLLLDSPFLHELTMAISKGTLMAEDRSALQIAFEKTGMMEKVMKSVMQFLNDNAKQLPMYIEENILHTLLQARENSPLHHLL